MQRLGVILAIVLWSANALAAQPFGPFRTPQHPVTSEAKDEEHKRPALPSGDPFAFAFQVYQKTLSSQDGPRCAHAPTCSAYGLQAVRRHRVMGFFLTAERLWRANRSSQLRPLPAFFHNGVRRYFDPVDANDFWLRGIPDVNAPEYLPARPRQ